MDQIINKKFKFVETDEHFDGYLSAIGLNIINRKLAKSIPSSTEIVKISDNEYGLNTILPFKTYQQKFVLGQETENNTSDGRKIKNLFTLEGNKLIEKQIEPNREVTVIREFVNDKMLGTCIVGKIVNKHVSILTE